MPRKLAIFGCGSDLSTNIEQLKKEFEIVGIFDNNSALQGKEKHGFKISNPEKILTFDFDILKICSLANTTKIRTQAIDLGVPEEKIMPTPLWCDRNFAKWTELKNQRMSDRIFIIGNGPSLNMGDLDLLHRNHELSIAFNKIYLAFNQTVFRPTYYMIEDLLVAQNTKAKVDSLNEFPKFMPEFLTRHLAFSDNDFIYGLNSPPNNNIQPIEPTLDFHNFGWGGSVTCSAIQTALFTGYKEIILLGVDNSFQFSSEKKCDRFLVGKGERNHFHPDYRPKGEKWNFPPINIINEHYIMLKKLAAQRCSKIFNCTRGGKVEVFERRTLEDVLS